MDKKDLIAIFIGSVLLSLTAGFIMGISSSDERRDKFCQDFGYDGYESVFGPEDETYGNGTFVGVCHSNTIGNMTSKLGTYHVLHESPSPLVYFVLIFGVVIICIIVSAYVVGRRKEARRKQA